MPAVLRPPTNAMASTCMDPHMHAPAHTDTSLHPCSSPPIPINPHRLPALAGMGYSSASIASQYSALARVCLISMHAVAADTVMARAEDAGYGPLLDPVLYTQLHMALGGAPRQRDASQLKQEMDLELEVG